MSRYFHSFYTPVDIYLDKGVTIIEKCLLDSGMEHAGLIGVIDSSVVKRLKLRTFRRDMWSVGDGGKVTYTSRAINLPVTFKKTTCNITLDLELQVFPQDIKSWDIMVGMGVMERLRAVQYFSPHPSRVEVVRF